MNEQFAAIDDRHHEVVDTGRLEILDEVLTGDFVAHVLAWPPEEIIGIEGYKGFIDRMRRSFPDLRGEAVRRISEGDTLVCHSRLIGTHQGEFMGMAPTGKQIVVETVNFLRFRDGRIAEMTLLFDAMGVAMQLGMLPQPAMA